MSPCDGCRFQGFGSKRCNFCSRNYLDRFDEPKKLTAAERERAKEALLALGLMQTITHQARMPYVPYLGDTVANMITEEQRSEHERKNAEL